MTDSGAERAARRIVKDWFCEVNGDWHREICEQRVAAIIREETGTQWIPVGERLPELNGLYLAYRKIHTIGESYYEWHRVMKYCAGKFYFAAEEAAWVMDEKITHWMPLPAAPDEGGTR